MPIVKLNIIPELMNDDQQPQLQKTAQGITEAIVANTGAPAESVHVIINKVYAAKYSVAGTMLNEQSDPSKPVER